MSSLLKGIPIVEAVDDAQGWVLLSVADAKALDAGYWMLATVTDTGPAACEIADVEYVRVSRGRRARAVVGERGIRIVQRDGRYVERGIAGSTAQAHAAGSELLQYFPDARPGQAAREPAASVTVTWT